MITIAQVSEAMQRVLTASAEKVAEESQLIQRRRKVTGANLSQTLVLGWLSNPQATLEELCQTGAAVGLEITPQGLEQRFTPEASRFLEGLLAETVTTLFAAEAVAIPVLQRFNGVYISDSSVVPLPDELHGEWAGCGGQMATSRAAIKLQLRLDMLSGRLEGPQLCAGRLHDQAGEALHEPLPAGALHLADLGYWKLGRLAALSTRGCYWLSRLQVQPKLIDVNGTSWNQVDLLGQQIGDTLDRPVRLGMEAQLPARLLGARVPPAVAAERRRRLKETARSKGQTVSKARLALADWTLLVTNVPPSLLTLAEALVLARLRWQIELLFKLWKSDGQIARWRTVNPWRILCELYAKLIAMVIQHWCLLLGNWSAADRSWVKAAKTIRQHALSLALSLPCHQRLCHALLVLVRCLAHGCRINKSNKTPRHYQLLFAVDEPV
jgi:hypothetical protein